MKKEIEIWTIFDRPTDFPDDYIARRFVAQSGLAPYGTPDQIVSRSLDLIRGRMKAKGLTCIPRDANDQPRIIESWF